MSMREFIHELTKPKIKPTKTMATTAAKKQEGIVKFFNVDKGYGFIKATDSKEYFVHNTGLIDNIKQDDHVSFELAAGKKGENAVNVTKI
jgi:CspA family cold shock protein